MEGMKTGHGRFEARLRALLHYRQLLSAMVRRDIKLKFRRLTAACAWSALSPLVVTAVMAAVFSTVFKLEIEHFPVYILTGYIIFSFVRESGLHCITSITAAGPLLKKGRVPQCVFPVSKVTADLAGLAPAICALVLAMVATGVPLTPYFLLIFIPILEVYVFSVGLGLFLAQAAVFIRGMERIWDAACTVWMCLTPIFYNVDALPGMVRWVVVRFNPLYYYITVFRDLTVNGMLGWPANIWRGGIVSAAMLAIGAGAFYAAKNRLILHI